MSNPNQTRVIVRNPETEIPEQYLRLAIKDINCGGYAVQVMKDNEPLIVSDHNDTAPSLEEIQELLKAHSTSRVLLALSKLEKVTEGTYSPFDFNMPGDPNPLMSFAIEGDFPSLIEAGITQEGNFAKKVILPNFNKFLKIADGNLDKFIAEIRDETFVDSLMVRIGDRGVFCFLPPVGDAIWLGKNKLGSTFPWGQVSHTLGYTETPKQEVKPKTGWWGSSKGKDLPVAQDPKVTQPAQSPPPVPLKVDAPQPDTTVTPPPTTPTPPVSPTGTPEGEWKELPPGLSQKDKKAFVRRVTGCGNDLPDGYDKPGWKYFQVTYPSRAKTLEALKDKLIAEQPKDMRDPKGEPRPAPVKGSETSASEASALILSVEEATAAEETIIKIMDRQGKEVPNPLTIQKHEQKYPSFLKKFGVTLSQIESWLPEDVAAFAKTNPKAFFHLFLEVKRAKLEAEQALALANSNKPAVVAPEPPKEEPVKQVANSGWSSWGGKK